MRIIRIAAPLAVLCACASPTGGAARASMSPARSTFEVEHSIHVPAQAGKQQLRLWFPLPREEEHQTVSDLRITAPPGHRTTTDRDGNRYVYVEAPAGADVDVVTRFHVERREYATDVDPARSRPLTDAERAQYAAFLHADKNIVIDDSIRSLAAQIRGNEQNPVLVARKLYDWTLDNVEYWVKDPSKWKASPVGSSEYCLKNRTGNCTDFHSLWTALARSSGIPTRLEYGSLFKPSLDGKDQDASYHCWPESWFPGIGWVPNDVAVADIYRGPIALDANNKDKVVLTTAAGYSGPDERYVDYYFGNLDSRRVAWTQGRDLQLDPPQQAGPVNAIAKGYVEVDGQEFTGFQRKMTYREVTDR